MISSHNVISYNILMWLTNIIVSVYEARLDEFDGRV